MPNISEYTSQLIVPQYNPQSYDINLEVAVAQKNQANYNRVLNTVRGLQSQALNIQMLNSEGRQRLDQYNKELNEQLSGDLGDLNKIEVQNEVANYFQRLTGDTQLIKASQLSSQYQNQLDMIESFRQSGRKDKGYNSINEAVFREWDGGLYDFANSSLSKVTDTNFQPVKYTPFKELDTKLLNIAKTLHADTTIREGGGSEGYLVHKEITEVSPEKIREMMLTQFDQEDLEQLDVLAKYEVIQNRKLNTIPQFYDKYNSFADGEIKRVETQADTLKQQADYYTSLINKKDTSDEKKLEYAQVIEQLKANSKLYTDRATILRSNKKGLGDFEKMSNNELLEYAKEIQWHNKINGLSNALSWKKDVETVKPDQVWMFNKKMDVMMWQENLRAQTKLNVARIQREGKSKSESPQFSGPIDSVRSTQSFIDSYPTLVKTQEAYASQTNRVITESPSFIKSQLLDDKFLEQNKNNYEIKMWDIFKREQPNLAIQNGQPQVEAFKLWLKDKEANPDPFTSKIVEQQSKAEIISDYLDIKLAKINELTREKSNEYDMLQGYPLYKADGTSISRDEYNRGIPAYLGVPTNKDKTNFKLVKVEDALNEIKSGKKVSREVQKAQNIIYGGTNPLLSTLTPVSNLIDSEGQRSEYVGYLSADPGLVETLNNLINTKETVNKQLEQQLISELPQIFQMPLVEAINDEAKEIYMPDVVSAAKNSNEGKDMGQFAISVKDIAFMRPPTTGDIGQFSLTPEVSKTYGELGWRLPDAADPTKTVLIQPGVSYAFRTNKPYMPYDVLLNEAAKEMPIKDKYKGFVTTLSKSKLDNSITVVITNKEGQEIGRATSGEVQDVNAALQAARRQIDVEINYQTKQKKK